MGHFHENAETKSSYEFIFTQLKKFDFDWHYEYPALGVLDFSKPKETKLSAYNPNTALEEELSKQEFFHQLSEMNAEVKGKIQKGFTPVIIIAYANIYGKYPDGWEGI
jgi:hypothetical protein